ncbi:MAG: hypothetical protein R3A45_06685 [Bdellovibrionota bacterium]
MRRMSTLLQVFMGVSCLLAGPVLAQDGMASNFVASADGEIELSTMSMMLHAMDPYYTNWA